MPDGSGILVDNSISWDAGDRFNDPRDGGLAALNRASDPGERLSILARLFPVGTVFTTSFGLEDQMITHLICTMKLPIEIVTLDTGRLFPSTYKLWEDTEGRYARRIRSYHPDAALLSAHLADAGVNGFRYSVAARLSCCEARKVEPLSRALDGAAAWVTGLRADQSGHRSRTPVATWEDDRQLMKVAPLSDWSRAEVLSFCEEHQVPLNPLHKEGYLSIGCQPCTRAVRPGESERAGRWWWERESSSECGLHFPQGRD